MPVLGIQLYPELEVLFVTNRDKRATEIPLISASKTF